MPLTNGLISFWELDELSGLRADQVIASGNHLTDNGTVTQNPGKVGQAAQFVRANNEYLSRASNPSLQCGDIDFTIVAWIYMDSKADNNRIMVKDNTSPAGARDYLTTYRFTTDRFEGFVFKPTDVAVNVVANTFGSPLIATWYFFVCWHDATADTLNISINNGGTDSVATGGALQAAGGAEFRLGSAAFDGAVGSLDGRLDQPDLYKRVLTAADRTFLYNNGNGVSYADIRRYSADPSGKSIFPKEKPRRAVLSGRM